MKKCIIISCITLLFLFTFSGALAEKQQIALTKELQALVNETGKFDEFTILTAVKILSLVIRQEFRYLF